MTLPITGFAGDHDPQKDFNTAAVYVVAVTHDDGGKVRGLEVRRLQPSARGTYTRLKRRKRGTFTWCTPQEAEEAARRMQTEGCYTSSSQSGASYAGE